MFSDIDAVAYGELSPELIWENDAEKKTFFDEYWEKKWFLSSHGGSKKRTYADALNVSVSYGQKLVTEMDQEDLDGRVKTARDSDGRSCSNGGAACAKQINEKRTLIVDGMEHLNENIFHLVRHTVSDPTDPTA